MRAMQPWALREGEPLSPTLLNRAKQASLRDLRDLRARRVSHTKTLVPFNDVDETDGTAERSKLFQAPWALEIESLEAFVYGDDNDGGNAEVDFTFTATGIVGWEDFTVRASSEDLEVRFTTNRRMRIAANQEVVISFTAAPVSGTTWRITRGEVQLAIRGDRYEGAPPAEPAFTPHTLAASDPDDVNVFCDELATAVDDDAAHTSFPAVLFVARDNLSSIVSTENGSTRLALAGRSIHSAHGYAVVASGTDALFNILDEAGVSIFGGQFGIEPTADVNVTSKSSRIAAGDVQPLDPANNTAYRATLARAAATARMYMAIYSR
jgi:hypothetical protein